MKVRQIIKEGLSQHLSEQQLSLHLNINTVEPTQEGSLNNKPFPLGI